MRHLFWAAFLLGLRYLAGIPSIFATLFYGFYGYVVADRAAKGGLRALGTSVRLGTKRRVALFAILALFAVFNLLAAIPLGYDVSLLTVVLTLALLTVTASITLVGGACLYDALTERPGQAMSDVSETRLTATPASAGVAVGPAIVVDPQAVVVPDVTDPAAAFSEASAAVSRQLAAMCETARESGRSEAGDVLEAQALMAQDPMLADAVAAALGEGAGLNAALQQARQQIEDVFAAIDDPYIAARAQDVVEGSPTGSADGWPGSKCPTWDRSLSRRCWLRKSSRRPTPPRSTPLPCSVS